ncbi:VanZ family protein [Fusibacter paucivorans]|uniref:VanZ family protein n=1 Tax=Fusibacter paucivorans TaxID=76009 RepID=A0ABS5PJ28_9FIRM|nr:VanZ family protein [Fusibacter paucivorans]
MNDFLMKGYESLTVILPFLITYGIFYIQYRQGEITQPKWRFLIMISFVIYVIAVFYFTGMGTVFDLQRYGIRISMDQVNLLPFDTGINNFTREIDWVAYFLNVLLFMPFGFLMPLIWPKMGSIKMMFFAGFSFSLLIEVSQLINYRQTDVDDIILNTLGAVLGYLIFYVFRHIVGDRLRLTAHSHYKYEPAIYLFAMSIGHFMMYDAFGLAKILYGF